MEIDLQRYKDKLHEKGFLDAEFFLETEGQCQGFAFGADVDLEAFFDMHKKVRADDYKLLHNNNDSCGWDVDFQIIVCPIDFKCNWREMDIMTDVACSIRNCELEGGPVTVCLELSRKILKQAQDYAKDIWKDIQKTLIEQINNV